MWHLQLWHQHPQSLCYFSITWLRWGVPGNVLITLRQLPLIFHKNNHVSAWVLIAAVQMRKQGLRWVKCFVQGHSATNIPEQSYPARKVWACRQRDEETGQVCPDLTSLAVNRTKEALKDAENQAAFRGVPGGFSGKGKLPCTEITLKPSFLGQFCFVFFLFSSLKFQAWLDHALDLSRPRAML